MNRTSVLNVMVMAVALASSQSVFAAPAAAPAAGHTPVYATSPHTKMVRLTLRNDSNAAMKVKVGDNDMTLEPGKPVDVKIAVGQTVVTEDASATTPAGTLLATVIDGMSGATIVLR
jgi:hypothetical protein